MSTSNRFSGDGSGCDTPPFLSSYFEDDQQIRSPGERTPPDRVAFLTANAFDLNFGDLQASVVERMCLEDILSSSVQNCFEGQVMKVFPTSDSAQQPLTSAASFLKPPPPPFPEQGFVRPAARLQPAKPLEKKEVVESKGSMGHPVHCGSACRWVKRKGGCQEGSDCPNCHLCFWSRNPCVAQVSKLKEVQKLVHQLEAMLGGEELFSSTNPKDNSSSQASFHAVTEDDQGNLAHPFADISLNQLPKIPTATEFLTTPPILSTNPIWNQSEAKLPPGLSTNPSWNQSEKEPPSSLAFRLQSSKEPMVHEQPESQAFHWQMSVGSTGHPHSCGPPCKFAMKAKGCKDGLYCDHCHLCHWMRYRNYNNKQPIEIAGRMSY